MGDKGETHVNSCGPRHPEWERVYFVHDPWLGCSLGSFTTLHVATLLMGWGVRGGGC